MIYILAVISIMLGAIGQFTLKLAAGELRTDGGLFSLAMSLINQKLILAIACFVLSMLMWIFVLKKLELSIAYPMVSLGYVFVMLISFFFLQEQIYLTKVLGTGLIVTGVILLNLK
ncbi:MAG TPA: EamA family transporter [Peptococcaceae bacterium]|nr:EamA family transporter [Peptococcaceae bacterium]